MIINVASAFQEAGCRVDLVVVRKEGPLLKDVPSRIRVVSLDCGHLRYALWPLIRYLRCECPEAVMATLTSTSMLAVVACKLSGVGSRIVLRQASAFGRRQRRWLIRRVYPYADAFIAQSGSMADDLIRIVGLPSQKVTTIRNPAFRPEIITRAAEPVGHPWFSKREAPVVIGVGRLARAKGFDVLLDAFAKVRALHPCKLVILGEGDAREKLQTQAERLGLKADVWMPGFVDNPFKYVVRSDVFVLSSRLDPCPNVLVEALAVGTPVVSTRCVGGASEILEDGRWGTLVPIGDSEAMAEAIRQNIESPAHTRSELSEYAQTFDYRSVAREYMAVLGVDLSTS
jgi:glycosyltransferase involved in cell wall biosynthesis